MIVIAIVQANADMLALYRLGLADRVVAVLGVAVRSGVTEWFDALLDLLIQLLVRANHVEPATEEYEVSGAALSTMAYFNPQDPSNHASG